MRELAAQLGISDVVRFEPPCPQAELAQWYRAATVMLTPSHSESFGLVALEAQACGTPVVAASVGGLRTVVKDGDSGVLVDGHDPADWARVIRRLVTAPERLHALSAGARDTRPLSAGPRQWTGWPGCIPVPWTRQPHG